MPFQHDSAPTGLSSDNSIHSPLTFEGTVTTPKRIGHTTDTNKHAGICAENSLSEQRGGNMQITNNFKATQKNIN